MPVTVDAARVRAWLGGANETYDSWVRALDDVVPTPMGAGGTRDLQPILDRLGFTRQDAAEVQAARLDPRQDPELWWLLERSRQQLVDGMGRLDGQPDWPTPTLPAHAGEKGRYFYVHLLLTAFDDALAYHRGLGIDERISWATFADLGRQVAINRRIHGRGGLHVPGWLRLHVRGLIYDMGRLQFNRALENGAYVLGTHIPENGPMSPEACDEAFARAARFFPAYFPGEEYREASCMSWLMDEQLASYLPAESNILRFQRRFRLPEGPDPEDRNGDSDIVEFVFRRNWGELMASGGLDELPTGTSLQRAIVQHLRAGGHWRIRKGLTTLR